MEVEWLILADSAQVVANKLYVLGGGWDRVKASKGFPFNQKLAVAMSVKVPWNETNDRHNFEVEIVSEDQSTEQPKSIAKIGGQFEVGRPVGVLPGQDQRIQLAIDLFLKIDSPGIKIIIARINGIESRRVVFNVDKA